MSKYSPLTTFLRRQPGTSFPMTFAEIEKVVGTPLPPSAYKHRPWWSNNTGNSVLTQAWREAGWITSNVDMAGRKLVFRRTAEGSAAHATPKRSSGQSLIVQGLSPETMQALQVKAEAAGRSVAEIAAELLTVHAKPSMAERLSFADRIRAAGRAIRGIDVPGMIRNDRDAR